MLLDDCKVKNETDQMRTSWRFNRRNKRFSDKNGVSVRLRGRKSISLKIGSISFRFGEPNSGRPVLNAATLGRKIETPNKNEFDEINQSPSELDLDKIEGSSA